MFFHCFSPSKMNFTLMYYLIALLAIHSTQQYHLISLILPSLLSNLAGKQS